MDVSSCMYSSWSASCIEDEKCRVSEKNKKRDYKHVPHSEKPAQVVAKRNARERRRVEAVNLAFAKLRRVVPVENATGKRISKVKTLQHAIEYIQNLADLLEQYDGRNYQFLTHYHNCKQEDLLIYYN